MTGWRRLVSGWAALLLSASLLGCGHESLQQQALNDGAARARSRAREAAAEMEALLRSPYAPRSVEDLHSLDQLPPPSAFGIVFGRELRPDGTIVADMALHEVGHAQKTEVKVRMCIRLSGQAGPTATVQIANTPCSPDLPAYVDGIGGRPTVVLFGF